MGQGLFKIFPEVLNFTLTIPRKVTCYSCLTKQNWSVSKQQNSFNVNSLKEAEVGE